ncbi:predicted protein [Uncinocarpus reesii 1704]|uniref:Protein kinase domain-containing protein n=1 Tax=Uncinocarpus reesii (strain UAMH 1704) TaxID=336963 RepID=C4JSV0_UNCRE|nr:uncharacterized protein UREG_05539 [Uncinocarpus reesii 1704]EEP80697.1 predicted protein [Uncinocarpus reesii 1704]
MSTTTSRGVPLSRGTMLTSDLGRSYRIEEVLAGQRGSLLAKHWRKELHYKEYDSGRVRISTEPAEETIFLPWYIKPNNILVDYEQSAEGQVTINNVMISPLEDTVIVPPGKWLIGPLCGNAFWRSPESWCRSRQNQASDVFSFGIVMIYVMGHEMVFHVSDKELKAADSWQYILRRHISYFADEDGLTHWKRKPLL